MKIDSIKEHYEIRFSDIDPDTGEVSQDEAIAMTMNKNNAEWIKEALIKDWFSADGPNDPNREFYVYKQKEIKL